MTTENQSNLTLIRQVRESRGLTIAELSRLTKVPENTLYSIEQGRCGVSADRAKAISICLKVPLDQLFESSSFHAKKN
ncbi:helix-turn-helix transcriptional regulator [Bacillus cereus]|nr:helix-turn-helix transcriptional regulator [Bacillus cereus]MDA2497070.1 helix-turn-helix transcriptional regulator [Bacillus cereus]